MLTDMTIKEFCNLLASKEPAPGGGSVSALSGVLAAGLGLMVINLTVGKKAFQAMSDEDKQSLNEAKTNLESEYSRLTELIDDDTRAFNGFMEARAMPKDDPARASAIEKASLVMTETPLETCGRCLSVLKNLKTVFELGNKNAASDAGTGIWLAFTGIQGAAMNVRINLPGLSDEETRLKLSGKVESLVNEGKKLV